MNNAPYVFNLIVKASSSANLCLALSVLIVSEYFPHLGTSLRLADDDLCANGPVRNAVEFNRLNQAIRQLDTD